jgi:predicted glycoside hydrolase/deacetylase ChbG (UPF0249 family)
MPERRALIITADDYGYSPGYDRGIVEVAGAGAVDSVSVMVTRDGLAPEPLLETGVEVGLHLELPRELSEGDRAGAGQREAALAAIRGQIERFESELGRAPAYLDGHRHCHAHAGLASALAREAALRGLPMRSIDPAHRRILRRGVSGGAGAPPPPTGWWGATPRSPSARCRPSSSRSRRDRGCSRPG